MTEPASAPENAPPARDRRHFRVAAACVLFVGAMVGATYASVPLYDMFCRLTGFGGTPVVAQAAPDTVGERMIRVMFDANVSPNLPWSFAPETRSIRVRPGETKLVLYRVTNMSNRDTWGAASYNVAPELTGPYFAKLECFCFSTQHLGPGESMDMPVVFYIDPEIETDPDGKDIPMITLSYTFHGKPAPASPAASLPSDTKPM